MLAKEIPSILLMYVHKNRFQRPKKRGGRGGGIKSKIRIRGELHLHRARRKEISYFQLSIFGTSNVLLGFFSFLGGGLT